MGQNETEPANALSLDHPEVIRRVEEYRAALEAGGRPDRQQLLDAFPALAADLAGCLDGLDLVCQVAPQLRGDGNADQPCRGSRVTPLATIGDFRIVREIGRGGMGVVYEAEQLSLGRTVALKVLPFAAMLDDRQLKRFKNEARAAATLNHHHIVPIYSVGQERGVHYYAMQLVEGQSLAEVIAELKQEESAGLGPLSADLLSGRFADVSPPTEEAVPGRQDLPFPAVPAASGERPQKKSLTASPTSATHQALNGTISTKKSVQAKSYFQTVARLAIQAAEALEHAHQNDVLHRDIKPANLMLDRRGNLLITDFGLARIESDAGMTMTGDLLGTLRYMSPEQALAKRVVIDQRTDIYSLGATLYELLTLKPVFVEDERQKLLHQIAFEDPRAPRLLNPKIPDDLETILLKALAKNPHERYLTAQELADDLRRFLDHEPIRARRPTLVQLARRWVERHQAASTAAAVTLLATALVSLLAVLSIAGINYRLATANASLREQTALARSAAESERAARESETKERDRAVANEQRAVANEQKANEQLYIADVRLGPVDWEAGNIGRLSSRLVRQTIIDPTPTRESA